MKNTLKFIGHINTPYNSVEECPNNIDPQGPLCKIVIDPDYQAGLTGLKVGQSILILYWFENVDRNIILQKPCNSNKLVGTFSVRSPHRPNPIAAAILPIEEIDNQSVSVRGLDCIDKTHLLDIKPAKICSH